MATIEHLRRGWRVRELRSGKLATVATTKTKEEAEVFLRRLNETKRARSRVVRGPIIPLPELIERWQIAKQGAGNDPLHTRKAADRMRATCAARNWASTSSITAAAVSAYRVEGGSPRGCAFLAGLLRWASDSLDQYVDPRALTALRPGRTKRTPQAPLFSDQAVVDLEAKAAGMSDGAGLLIHCLCRYGWRPITAARLTVGDFDAITGQVTTSVKGGDTVRHPLLPATVALMRSVVALRPPEAPLFINPRTGEPWALDGAQSIPQWARKHLRIAIYDLKRYAISSMLDRGVEPHTVALFTGHRTISQVFRYARTNEQRARAALEKFAAEASPRGKSMESPPEITRDRGAKTIQFPGINRTFQSPP